MSVTTNSGSTPSRMRIVYDFVKSRRTRGISREELKLNLFPAALGEIGQTVNHPIVTAEGLHLIKSVKGVYTVGDGLADSDLSFLHLLEERLLRPSTPDEYGHHQFQKALAWFLMQSPIVPLDWDVNPSQRIEKDCGEGCGSFELTNARPRLQQFAHWARFLGFARIIKNSKNATNVSTYVVPDPTEAIRRYVKGGISNAESDIPSNFIRKLSEWLPVLDSGSVRNDVEDMHSFGSEISPDVLSASITFALQRLERSGDLELVPGGDSPNRIQLSPETALSVRETISEIRVA